MAVVDNRSESDLRLWARTRRNVKFRFQLPTPEDLKQGFQNKGTQSANTRESRLDDAASVAWSVAQTCEFIQSQRLFLKQAMKLKENQVTNEMLPKYLQQGWKLAEKKNEDFK